MAYGPSTGATFAYFHGRSMRTIMTEAPQLTLASFLSEIRETRHAALRRTTLKRTREGDDNLPPHQNNSEQLPIVPAGFSGLSRTCAELVTC